MGKKASWNPLAEMVDAVSDVLNGSIFDLGDAPVVKEKVTNAVDSETDESGDGGEPERGDGDGTENVVKPIGTKPTKRPKKKGEASGDEESDTNSDSESK